MSACRPPRHPEDLRREILAFLGEMRSPVLVEEDGAVIPLVPRPAAAKLESPARQPRRDGGRTHRAVPVDEGREEAGSLAAGWRLEVEFGKLLLAVWGDGRSLVRRIENAEHDGKRMRLRAYRPAAGRPVELGIREADDVAGQVAGSDVTVASGEPEEDAERRCRDRDAFEAEFLAMLARQFPGLHFEQVSHRADREHCFSVCYTRGSARRGREAWAFLGLGGHEGPSAVEGALVHGLIWLDWLRARSAAAREAGVVTGLKLFLPPHAAPVAAHRAAYLDRRASGIEIFEWERDQEGPRAVDIRDYGNVQTRLTARWRGARLIEQTRPLVRELLQGLPPALAARVTVAPDALGEALSLRVFGLAVAQIEAGQPAAVSFGLEGERRELAGETRAEFREFLESVLRVRRPRGPGGTHPYYRLQPERWLESLLVDDIARLDPALRTEHVYPQVPAFTGPATPGLSRGVIDILSAARDPETGSHRLAVVELKLDEDPNLPLQGLDYWLRVKWLEERDQFREYGYFAGLDPSRELPVLYLVSPAFRFHSTTERILRYFQPSIRVVKVGLNQRWREGVKVLFRRRMIQGRPVEERALEVEQLQPDSGPAVHPVSGTLRSGSGSR